MLLTPDTIRAHGFDAFTPVDSPIFVGNDGKKRSAKTYRFKSVDEALRRLRSAPGPVYVFTHPNLITEDAGRPGFLLRGALGDGEP